MSRFSTTLLPVRPKTKNRTPAFNRPFAFDDFRSDLENMFQRFWTGWMPFTKDYGNYNWDFDTTEYEKEYVVKAELPGFEENEIDVQFSDNYLTIKAEHKSDEDGYRTFNRTMLLPFAVDPNKIKAVYHNGVLELHINKPETAMLKRIPISAK
jgi:HSP20 family protein